MKIKQEFNDLLAQVIFISFLFMNTHLQTVDTHATKDGPCFCYLEIVHFRACPPLEVQGDILCWIVPSLSSVAGYLLLFGPHLEAITGKGVCRGVLMCKTHIKCI